MHTPIEYRDLDPQRFFSEVAGSYRPAILRGFVRHWPAVQAALRSPEALCQYVLGLASNAEVDAVMTPPAERGRLFYSPDMKGFNFVRNKVTLARVIEQLARYSQFDAPPSVAIQSALIDDCMPRFSDANVAPALPPSVRPRLWLGNTITTPAHFDQSCNLACVVSGQRRFTLFPPEQVANLYIGPVDFAPTPTPISMVHFSAPDDALHPLFREALPHAQVADLLPGDALYLPTLWWHHVQSTGPLNMMVNYWWKGEQTPEVEAGRAAIFRHLKILPKDF
ncbi:MULTISPECIES: cupin-like domain-containing protein [unclassified Duganella]|uniref:cupin-like domain-containing protein n=1 Tax=unclassified Duganella TaxID=2636909 RepID=UPI000885BB1C|nr:MULTISPECIES: cupin-like domain-containing protein [unclassified Duganella]SDH10094.1 Cupin-like domain-containing protein [Duganella sp. OV458]SDK16061.1 Cupin-like domain-containing protein [Duganella sp. OV510]